MKEWLSLLTSLDKIRSEFLIALTGTSLFLVLCPAWLLRAFGFLQVIDGIRTWIGITLLLSLSLLITRAAGLALRFSEHELQLFRSKKLIDKLSGEELGFLGEFIERDVASIQAPFGDGLTGALMTKRLVFRASQTGNVLSGFAYSIQPWVKDYLKKRPNLWAEHTAKRLRRRSSSASLSEF